MTGIVNSVCNIGTRVTWGSFCVCPANERRRYNVRSSLIGWAHTQNNPCYCGFIFSYQWCFVPPPAYNEPMREAAVSPGLPLAVFCCQTLSQSPCTALMAGNLLAVRAVQGDCQQPLKNNRKPHLSHESTIPCDWGNADLYLDQPIIKDDVSQLEALYHTLLTILLPRDQDCVAV